MDAKKREIRTVECGLRVREAQGEGTAAGESRTIVGTAIVFNAESEVLDDWGDKFREIILPEAATMEFLKTQDIKMNLLHERELTIARCNKGEGNMRLSVDEEGVHFEFEAPKCDIGDRALELVKAGVYSGCSFEFYTQDYEVEERGEEVIIKHKGFRALEALTIGMSPAYKQTSVSAREVREGTDTFKARKAKDEDDAKAALEREMERRAAQLREFNDFEE